MTPEACFEDLRGKLRGAPITDRQLAGSSLSIWVATDARSDAGYSIWFDTAWRLSAADQVLAGSKQAEEAETGWDAVSEAIDAVVGQRVEAIEFDGASGDLLVSMTNGLVARTLNSDPRAEMLWWIHDRSRRLNLSGSPSGLAVNAAT
jgi:hypothetical protein